MKRETFRDVRSWCDYLSIEVSTWAPGDGVTRYRFHALNAPHDYHADPHPLGTCLGVKKAIVWLHGYDAGVGARHREVSL